MVVGNERLEIRREIKVRYMDLGVIYINMITEPIGADEITKRNHIEGRDSGQSVGRHLYLGGNSAKEAEEE